MLKGTYLIKSFSGELTFGKTRILWTKDKGQKILWTKCQRKFEMKKSGWTVPHLVQEAEGVGKKEQESPNKGKNKRKKLV